MGLEGQTEQESRHYERDGTRKAPEEEKTESRWTPLRRGIATVCLALMVTEGIFALGSTMRYYKETGCVDPIKAVQTYPIGIARMIYGRP